MALAGFGLVACERVHRSICLPAGPGEFCADPRDQDALVVELLRLIAEAGHDLRGLLERRAARISASGVVRLGQRPGVERPSESQLLAHDVVALDLAIPVKRDGCGSMMSAQWAKGHGGLYRYYRCTRKGGNCSEPYVQEGALAIQCADILRPLSITSGEAAILHTLVDQEAANSGKAVEAASAQVADRLTAVQTKLNKLTRAYLDEVLDEESFHASKAELVVEKVALKQEKATLQKTGASYWIEPTKEFINTLETTGNCQEAKSPNELSQLVRKIGTNLLISRKKVTFDFSPPYDFASVFLAETRAAFETSPAHQTPLSGPSSVWCSGQDLNLHALRQRLLRPSCLPIPPPERSDPTLAVCGRKFNAQFGPPGAGFRRFTRRTPPAPIRSAGFPRRGKSIRRPRSAG